MDIHPLLAPPTAPSLVSAVAVETEGNGVDSVHHPQNSVRVTVSLQHGKRSIVLHQPPGEEGGEEGGVGKVRRR